MLGCVFTDDWMNASLWPGCDGNNNGALDGYRETAFVFKHLTLAGLIEGGKFSETEPSAEENLKIIDLPNSKPIYIGTATGNDTSSFYWSGEFGSNPYYPNLYFYATASFGPPSFSNYSLYLFDKKIDDGLPYSGEVQIRETSPYCATGSYSDTDVQYVVNPEDFICQNSGILFTIN
jgi:hypothetical protein